MDREARWGSKAEVGVTRIAGEAGMQVAEEKGACAWEAATPQGMAWPANPIATGCQGNPAQPASGRGCLPQPRQAVCTTWGGAH